jgi:hypothetical protein
MVRTCACDELRRAAHQEDTPAGCSKRPDFSPAQPWRAISPARPESAKTASSPRDAPYPKQGRSKQLTIVLPSLLVYIARDDPDESPTARNILTRSPTGRYFSPALPSDCFAIDFPGRAISACEGLLFHSLQHHTFPPKGVAGLSFTARIGRAPFHRARSASKKDSLAAPFISF